MACVLVVDDEQDIRDTVRFILEDAGHETLEAADGASALQLMRASQKRLVVLLDLLMSRMNGIDVLNEALADPLLKERHAYLLMTADNAALRRQADPLLAQLAAQVVSKPFDIDKLLEMIDHAAQTLV